MEPLTMYTYKKHEDLPWAMSVYQSINYSLDLLKSLSMISYHALFSRTNHQIGGIVRWKNVAEAAGPVGPFCHPSGGCSFTWFSKRIPRSDGGFGMLSCHTLGKERTRWWFPTFFYFHPDPWGMIQFDSYFSDGWFNHQLENLENPKNHWTLQWRGLNLYNRGSMVWVRKIATFWGFFGFLEQFKWVSLCLFFAKTVNGVEFGCCLQFSGM